ncbi:TPA: hypothetical protein DHW58_01535, partial [Patescibacteria group bacterium]|nr:hypothetical protein [Patescibacteria group bacterium]
IIKGEEIQKPQTPEAFNVIVKELQGLGLNVQVLNSAEELSRPIGEVGISANKITPRAKHK